MLSKGKKFYVKWKKNIKLYTRIHDQVTNIVLVLSRSTSKGDSAKYTLYVAPNKCFVLEVRAGIWRLAGKNWKVSKAGKYFSTVYSERRYL